MYKDQEELFSMHFQDRACGQIESKKEGEVNGHCVWDCFSPKLTAFSCVSGLRVKLFLLNSQNTNVLRKIVYKPIDFHALLTSLFANYVLTDSYYRNIHCSRINCFCFSVSLTQQNNLRQLNILYCGYGSHIHGNCAQGTLSYSLDSTVNIVEA